jgi:hypothetical protein
MMERAMSLNMEYFEAHPDEYLELSQENQATVFNGGSIEGETISESPAAETTTEETPANEAETVVEPVVEEVEITEPVVLAKDGQHTIPYEELLSARDQAKHYEQIAREQAALIESLKAAAPAPVEAKSDNSEMEALQVEYAEAKLLEEPERAQEAWSKLQALIEQRAEQRTREVVSAEFAQRDAKARQEAEQASFSATVAKSVEAYPFLDSTKPEANAEAIADVVTWRDALIAKGDPSHVALAKAVAKFGPMYAPKPDPAPSASKAAAQAIANAKIKPPASMSSIPSAATPPTDELQAMAGLSQSALQEKMMSMSPEKIMQLINRTVVA